MASRQSLWFATYHRSDWSPRKHGYNQEFADTVRSIREWFQLEKVAPGLERGTGYFVPYVFTRGSVYLTIDSFDWTGVERTDELISPRFVFTFRMANRASPHSVYHQGRFSMIFPMNYPKQAPVFYLDDERIRSVTSLHAHHVLNDGRMCLMEIEQKEWNGGREKGSDSVITALNWSIEWIHLHYDLFKW